MSPGLAIIAAVGLALFLKLCHDRRAYTRAWRDERQAFWDRQSLLNEARLHSVGTGSLADDLAIADVDSIG